VLFKIPYNQHVKKGRKEERGVGGRKQGGRDKEKRK
jgi:hypothetical protein